MYGTVSRPYGGFVLGIPGASKKRAYSGKKYGRGRGRAYPGYKSRRLRMIGRNILTYPETKYFDTGIAAAITFGGAAGWTGTEVPCDNYVNTSGAAAPYTDSCLIPTAIGSGYGQIIGTSYKLKKLRVRGSVYGGVATGGTSPAYTRQCRIMLVMDTSPCGAQAQGEDVIQDMGEAGENLFAFKRMPTTPGRFRILKDKLFLLDPYVAANDTGATGGIATNFAQRLFQFTYKPKLPLHVNVVGTSSTPTVASTVSHNIFLLLGAVQNATAQAINITASSRCYYCD